MSAESVRFFSAGRERPARLAVPNAATQGQLLPAVVLAHGLANDRDEAGQFGPLERRLVADGHVVCRFDFRGGVRDIDPGRHLPASEWTVDLLAAVAFTRDRDDVDSARVGIVGASCGGSVAINVAALDRALRYVVTLGSFADGERWLRDMWTRVHGHGAWEKFLQELVDDRRQRARGQPSRSVSLAGDFLPIPADQLAGIEQFLDSNPGMLRELALEVADDLLLFSPEQFGPRGNCPVLVVHGTDDALVPLYEADRLVASLGDRATLAIIDGGLHQLLLGDQTSDTLSVVSDWIAAVA